MSEHFGVQWGDPTLYDLTLNTDFAQVEADEQQVNLTRFSLVLPAGWESLYPQSAHLLREEVTSWQKTDWRLHLHREGSDIAPPVAKASRGS